MIPFSICSVTKTEEKKTTKPDTDTKTEEKKIKKPDNDTKTEEKKTEKPEPTKPPVTGVFEFYSNKFKCGLADQIICEAKVAGTIPTPYTPYSFLTDTSLIDTRSTRATRLVSGALIFY